MNAARKSLVLTSCVFCLAATPRADAGPFAARRDDCAPNTRHVGCESAAELRNAKRFESLNCAELAGYAESYRAGMNRQLLSTFYRPVAETAAAAAGALPQLNPPSDPVPSPSEPETAKPGKPSGFRQPAKPSQSPKIQSTTNQPAADDLQAGS